MQKKSLLQFWLLLCLMVAGATHAWADEVTYTFTGKGWTALIGTVDADWTSGKDGAGFSNNGVQVTTTATGANATSPVSYDNISKIVVTYNTNKAKGAGTLDVTIGNNAKTSKDWAYSSGDGTSANYKLEFDYETPQSGNVKLTVNTTTNSIYVVSVTITYSPVTTNAKLTGITLSGTYPTTFTEGDEFSHEGMTVTATFDDESTYNVTSSAVFSEPDMTTAGIKTVTVSYTANGETKEADYQITVNAIPTHTVTWSVNGQTSTTPNVKEGAAIEFPQAPGNVNGKVFVGWTTKQINGVTDTAPEMVTEATMGTADVTFYAVFADAVGAEAVTDKLNREFTGVTGTSYATWEDMEGTSGAVYAGNSAGDNESIQLRSNNSNSGVVTTTSAGKVSKVAVEWNSATNNARVLNVYGSNTAYTAATDLYDANKQGTLLGTFTKSNGDKQELTIDDDYAYVGVRSASGALYLASLSITWGGGATYSRYCTNVAADTSKEAGISFKEATVTKEIVENYTGQELTNPNHLTVTWTSSNEDVATVENGTVTVKAVGETTITATFAGNENYKFGSASYTLIIQDSRIEINPEFAATSVSVNVNETVNAPALNGNTGQAAVSYESSDPTIATVNEQGVVTGVADGEATITATIAATNQYQGATATFTVTVIDPNKKGTQTNPYTVAEAIDAIVNNGDVTDVYATGIVSQIVTAYNSQYGNITYDISADGTTDGAQLRAYRGKGVNGANFTSENDIQVGDQVVVYGKLKRHNDIYEFDSNNQLVSLSRKATPTLAFDTEAENYEILVGGQLTISAAVAEEEYEGTISYSSSDTDVAEIDSSTGMVTAKAQGTVTITATAEETENFKGSSVQIQLIVTDPSLANDIVISPAQNGLVEADKEKANEGETVTLTATPAAGYKLTGWTILDGAANDVEYIADGNTATFTMPATAVEVEASFAEIVYHDVMFYVAGQKYGEGASIEDGKTLTLPEDPTVEDFAFAGWSTTNDVTAPEFVTNATVVNNNMILYAMFVAKAGVNEYRKVTATEDITDGEYLIVYEEEGLAFNGARETLDAVDNNVSVTIKNGVIASTDKVDAATFTIDVTAGTLQSASGYYIGQTSDKNGLASSTETTYSNTFAIDENGDAVITAEGGCTLRYNDASNQNRFRYYASGQKAIALYKKIGTTIYFDGTIVDEVALSDAQDYTATTATVTKKVTLTRTVKANTWSSFVVPFDMAKPEGVVLKELSSSEIKEDGTVRLNFTDATAIEAGKPYMMRSDSEITKFSADKAVVLPAAQKQDAATTYVDMIGTYVTTSIPTGDYFFSNNVFKYVGAKDVTTKGFRAYFHLHDVPAAEGEARIVAFGLDDETTGIGGASHLNDKGEMINEVFDLSGRKVAQPTRGLYIVNGKKLFVK